MTRIAIFFRAFLDGLSGEGPFRRMDYPGAPRHFVDPRPAEEITATGDFDRFLHRAQVRLTWPDPPT